MSHVFISYSKQNQAYARRLADALIAAGFDVWIDDQIDYGEDWWRTIVRAIRGAKAFVAVMSEDSDASDWVQREVTLADKHKIPAFPLWLSGDMDASENWAIYVRTQYADVRGEKLPGDDFYKRLERAAPRKALGGENVTVAQPHSLPPVWNAVDEILAEKSQRIATQTAQATIEPPDVTTILPLPFEWCEIPAGQVTIEYSQNDHKTFEVPMFWMAKYPITNAQYQVFTDAKDGYADSAWWGFSDAAKVWRRENKQPQKTGFEGDDLPRTNISWYEAMAFCQWLTAKVAAPKTGSKTVITGNFIIMLPTEQQWQRAAQGDDGRTYPWGEKQIFDFNRRFTIEDDKTKPVTYYPDKASPYGVMDMSGNIWQWCSTIWETDNLRTQTKDRRVMRGGSFKNSLYMGRCAFRVDENPKHRDYLQGFRVAMVKLQAN